MSLTSSRTVALKVSRSLVLFPTSFSLDFVVLSCVTFGSPSTKPVADLDIELPPLEMEAEGEAWLVVCCLAGEVLKLRRES